MNGFLNNLSVLAAVVSSLVMLLFLPLTAHSAFVSQAPTLSFTIPKQQQLHMSSFVGDGSDYAPKESDFDKDDEVDTGTSAGMAGYREGAETPTVELSPVPMSKNSGNRFIAFIWDKSLDTQDRDVLDLHSSRISLTEDHVMFCRKRNLYNETFNTDSMVDILWSYPM